MEQKSHIKQQKKFDEKYKESYFKLLQFVAYYVKLSDIMLGGK